MCKFSKINKRVVFGGVFLEICQDVKHAVSLSARTFQKGVGECGSAHGDETKQEGALVHS